MKFFYNGKLIRTSKTHEYKYAVLNSKETPLACSSTLDGAKREYTRVFNDKVGWIKLYTEVLDGTYKPTKGGWKESDVRRWYKTDEELKAAIESLTFYIAGLKIVELEMKP